MDTNTVSSKRRRSTTRVAALVTLALALTASSAVAETLLMPGRDFLMGANEVVWGVSDLPNGAVFSIDFGDGTPVVNGNVADRSYIAFNHTYSGSGTFTVTLTVGGEVATTEVRVFNGGSLTPENLRGLNINRAIQDGLRFLWTAQESRALNFPAGVTTNWGSGGSFAPPYSALIALAFQNHGYLLPADNSAPTGIYPKYVVQRALNHVASVLQPLTLSNQPAGNPCVGALPDPCIGLYHTFDPGYSNAVLALPFAGSGALNRTVPAGVGNATYVAGKTFGSVLQRIMNSLAFGQNDFTPTFNNGRGGWIYQFSNNNAFQNSDGSTIGWDILSLLDAGAAGTVIPAFVKTEFTNHALPQGLNNDGSFDYRADQNPAFFNNTNNAKAGIGLQGQFYAGQPAGMGVTYVSNNWNAPNFSQSFTCSNGTVNKGCGYAMFNIFKALKLHGISTLPGVTRPAGPGAIPAGDWYADYVDWLVANQTNPQGLLGGNWGSLDFSCCESTNISVNAALAELILAPVALIQPDPSLFSQFGLSPETSTNPPGTSHTVTAKAVSTGNTPVPGATVNFSVIAGPNMGKSGSDVTDANGEATFTYQDTSAPPHGTDQIQAFIGQFGSNVVTKTWTSVCDVEPDGDVDMADLQAIRAANGQPSSGPNDARDANGDGRITVADLRYCQIRLTP